MDKNGTAAPQWQVFCQLKTKQLISVAEEFGNELKRRAELATDPLEQHFLILANVRLTECRAYLRNVQSHERSKPSAAPEPAQQRVAADVGAPKGDTTTSGAAESLRTLRELANRKEQCPRCRDEGLDHEGECRPLEEPEAAPLSPSPSQSELQGRGPRGPEAAEGAGEAGRAKQGPVDLAYHLAVLKGGAA